MLRPFVSNSECIRQVSQATRIDNEMGLDWNPVDLRVFAQNVPKRPVPATKIGEGADMAFS